ncbi:HD domain-containing protein [Atopobacter phocae]|uniref:HD domain-containing protein n=1 Tax=Atopobacter phocae TaxID=136492 RepID=UPI00046FB13A|nr:HD domain-containing protein [Atopobacter phocae]
MNDFRIQKIQKEMQEFFKNDTTGHDWFHIERVWQNARLIASHYPEVNHFQIEAAALLHDRYDRKLVQNTDKARNEVVKLLEQLQVGATDIKRIMYTIDAVSFKQGGNTVQPQSLEDKIVQDADRLDAIGAIGIARTFAYAGSVHHPIYTGEPSSSNEQTAIQHFHDKLLHIHSLMHTPEGKEIALTRHHFMEEFLNQFYSEWHSDK